MSIKPDSWIKKMAVEQQMIVPFTESQVRDNVISYGVSSFGYDFRVADEFKIFSAIDSGSDFIDPKNFNPDYFSDYKGMLCVIPANSFVLARSIEYFKIPRNILTICVGKSTYARSGIIINVTPFEPEWEGFVTLAISNTSPIPAKVYANEGIAQVIFFQSNDPCETSYADKKGKYQAQQKLTLPKI